MSDLTNRMLNDRYQIVRQIGAGGMGSVYLGHDLSLQRSVAIKIMHPHLAGNADFRARFRQEATTAAQLQHPGIIQVYDTGTSGDLLYIVMELVAGSNLKEMLEGLQQKRQWIPLREAVELVRQVAQAVGYAHRRGTIHRDLKPANIMVKDEMTERLPYHPVIADFGLAKLHEGGVDTQTGVTMGTPSYMSPEQTMGDDPIDARTDIYALGIVLYELVAGRPPLAARHLSEAMRYHLAETPPPPPAQFCSALPASIEAVILKAIQKRPQDRYASAEELAEALESVRAVAQTDSVPLEARGGAYSIGTIVQESLVAQSFAPTRVYDPQASSSQVREPQIVVQQPDGTQQRYPIKTRAIKIGRNPDNDIVLNDEKVSRYHAQCDFDGLRAWITDLESTNHTFLDGTELPARARTVWAPDQRLRIGRHTLVVQLVTSAPLPVTTGTVALSTPPSNTPPVAQLPQRRQAGRWAGAAIALLLLALTGTWYLRGQPDLSSLARQLAALAGLPPSQVIPPPGDVSPQPVIAGADLGGTPAPEVPPTATPQPPANAPGTGTDDQIAAAAEADLTATAAAEIAAQSTIQAATVTAQAVAIQTSVAATLEAIDAAATAEAAQVTATAAAEDALRLATAAAQAAEATAAAGALERQRAQELLATAVAQTRATATALAATIAAAAATQTVAAIPTATPTPPPPTDTPMPPTPTPLPPPPTVPPPTAPPPPPTPVPQPGMITDFERFGTWVTGDQEWGTITQSSANSAGGTYSGQITYDFTPSSAADDFVVLKPIPPLPIQGQPQGLRIQVYGDGSRNFLMAWLQDDSGTIWQYNFGRIGGQGWTEMSAPLDLSRGWPNSKIEGPGTSPTYPLKLYGLVINAEDRSVLTGGILVDELSATAEMPSPPVPDGGATPAATPNTGGGQTVAPGISCGVDPVTISRGQSATLFWTITGVRAVYLGNEGVAGIDKRTVKPDQSTTYTLRIVRTDGSETTCTMSIQVN